MKKLLAWLMTCILLVTSVSAVWAENAAEEKNEENAFLEENPEEEIPEEEAWPVTYDYNELTVAVTTPLTGSFFTNMWGNASSDVDVREMIHGYNLVYWDTENGVFKTDESVISGITVQTEENGNLTFIIALYEDLLYSDGTPITAWDYAFSMLLMIAPEMKEIGASVRPEEYLAGYDDYISGNAKELAGIRVISDHQMHITISSEYLPFFYMLGLLDCVPYPISVIAPGVKVADNGNGVYLTNIDEENETPVFTADLLRQTILDEETGYRIHPSVSSGPYTLVSFEDGVAEFELNPNYKGNNQWKKPTIPKVKMVSMPSEEMLQAYQDGTVTLLNKVSNAQTVADLMTLSSTQDILTFANYARAGLGFINYHADQGPLTDLAVRQAIAYLADRDTLVTEILGNYGLTSAGFFGMGQWMYLLLNGTVLYPVEEPAENATAAEKKEYEDTMAAWEALTLDDIEKYEADAARGAELLDQAGWNLNEKGEAYQAGQDTLRYKQTEEGLVPLKLSLAYAEGSSAAEALEGTFADNLAKAGIELKTDVISGAELLEQYYRQSEPKYDMLFLATNFDVLYDPSLNFIETEDGHHIWKNSGLMDDELWEMAVDMRKTEPGDLLGYCTKWLAFQKRFMEQMPVLPVYSNVYFDFFPQVLHEYYIAENISRPEAIIGAYLSDYIPGEEEDEEEDEFED